MDTDPEFDPHVLWDVSVVHCHGTLDFDRAAGSIDGTGEFHKHTVPGGLDDASTMGSYGRVNKSFSGRFEPAQSAFLVGTHEAAISGDISRQHRRQSPFYPVTCQWCPHVNNTGLSKHVALFVS
jgi:hypothetical protein